MKPRRMSEAELIAMADRLLLTFSEEEKAEMMAETNELYRAWGDAINKLQPRMASVFAAQKLLRASVNKMEREDPDAPLTPPGMDRETAQDFTAMMVLRAMTKKD